MDNEKKYYEEETDLSLLISQAIEDIDSFYRKIGELLTKEEKEYIKSIIPKSCNTCSNMSCRVEQVDKPIYDCIAFENNRIIGQYKVLKLNRINSNSKQNNN